MMMSVNISAISCILQGTVIASKTTASMNFPLSVANFIVGLEWALYGKFLGDFYVLVCTLLYILAMPHGHIHPLIIHHSSRD